jgi:hypothetical protein
MEWNPEGESEGMAFSGALRRCPTASGRCVFKEVSEGKVDD